LKPTARVCCPAERCGAIFAVADERLGRNVYCLSCGTRMTARPVEVEAELAERERRVGGSRGDGVRRLPHIALLDDIRSLWNVGSMFRTADACGVERLILGGITGCPPRAEISKTALGAENAVAWDYRADALVALEEALRAGYTAVALEDAPGAVPLDALAWPARPCLVVGNEVAGISPRVLEQCAVRVRIPMYGVKDSLNAAVAFGIAVHSAAVALVRGANPRLS
jgi:23S rRNA (guanosine2251-2'-O)-methyltransferase